MANADSAWTSAIGDAQTAAKTAQAQAEYDYATNTAYAPIQALIAAAKQRLTTDSKLPVTSFANVQPQPVAPSIFTELANAYKNDGLLGAFTYLADFATNGAYSRFLLSPQFTQALNAVDGVFAGWADKLTMGLSTRIRELAWGASATRNHQGQYFQMGQTIGEVHAILLSFANPCGMANATLGTAVRILNGGQAVGGVFNAAEKFASGDILGGALDLLGVAFNTRTMFGACFAKGTPLLLRPTESKPIEEIKSYEDHGDKCDWILTRSDLDPDAPLQHSRVLMTFKTVSAILNVKAGGRIIATTAEHPFWVQGKEWTDAKDLKTGDVLVSHTGQSVTVEEVEDTGRVETVYNLLVEDDHTYFVGAPSWGWDVWVHNGCDTNKIGRIGESVARDILAAKGWNVIETLSHGRNGIDIIAQRVLKSGAIKTIIVEVKANTARLSTLQQKGAQAYAQNVLGRLGNLQNLTPGARRAAQTLDKMIQKSEAIQGSVLRISWSKGIVKQSLTAWK